MVIESVTESHGYSCDMYESSDLGSPHVDDEFWVALHKCPPGFTDFGIIGGCYRFYETPGPWYDAEVGCNNLNQQSHLAGIDFTCSCLYNTGQVFTWGYSIWDPEGGRMEKK